MFTRPHSRRDVLKAAAIGLAAFRPSGDAFAALAGNDPVDLRVESIETIGLEVPYREVVARNMARELPHWRLIEVERVKLKSGHVGHGETMSFYTWGRTADDDRRRATGRNAASLLWDDSLGAGLQMALFDAVGRALGVPVYRLLGARARDRAALSWWAIDMPPEDWASECEDALKLGYTAFKTKGRPWFDVFAQVKAVAAVVPESFKLDMDFNDTLLDADRAIPILKELEKTSQVGIYETPIPQNDVPGNVAICEAVRTPIAMHYGQPRPRQAISEKACDGFVVGGGARQVMDQGAVAAMARMPIWLQLVGTGLTAAFGLHLAAVLRAASWPAVNCHQLFTHDLLARPIEVKDGSAAIPEGPGLGVEIDADALRRFKVDFPKARPEPARLVEVSWPDGRKQFIGNDGDVNFVLRRGMDGSIPYYVPGATTRLVPDDGSALWRERYDRAREKPFIEG